MKFRLPPKNEIPFTAENENGHSFSAEKRKSPDNISAFSFSYIQSPSQTSSSFAFFAGGPC